ncbi:MAG: arginase family protein [Alphaproteobacteria bacterium]|nr:arginase family protein [Alphaproteobacteria bacterium]
MDKSDWLAAAKRVRQQSARYGSGYIQDFDLDIFEHLKVVDFGDADIPPEANVAPTVENVLAAQAAVELKVNQALDAGAIPIVIGQNSPCGSFAIAKPISERTKGAVGMVSLDTHWDSGTLDALTSDPRIAGSASWKHKTYELLKNFKEKNLVEIGERGMLENKDIVRRYLKAGAHFYPMWKVRTELGIEGLVKELRHAYEGTEAVYAHFDMDVLGGAGPAPGDILGELAEPIGMTDYEVIRIAHEVGKRGLTGFSFICIPPGSAVVYRTIVYVIAYLMAGLVFGRMNAKKKR